ncbi:MAG: hypothetical protein AB1656_17055 [Candidatus Omnitrophota bacterium]
MYIFQLGHCPEVSYAEILAVNARLERPFRSFQRVEDVLFAEGPSLEAAQSLCHELGGVIRLCEEVSAPAAPATIAPESLADLLQATSVDALLTQRSERPVFGLSLAGDWSECGGRGKRHGLLHETAVLFKDYLREKGISSRFLLPDPQENSTWLSGAQVVKNQLLSKGLEIVLNRQPRRGVQLAVTRWIQPFEEYSQRDYGRPQRDARQGMLPPKLARMLINLARTKETVTLLDPFCGNGGILTEAALMGLQPTGLDIQEKNVLSCEENWRWLQSRKDAPQRAIQVMVGDACQLHTLCAPLFFDACATEPYLGPPQRKPLSPAKFEELASELVPLYIRALGEIRSVVKPGARVVFLSPQFQLADSPAPAPLRLLSEIKLLGYRILDPLHDFAPAEGRTTLLYSRPDQFVQREIFVLQA